MVAICLGLNVLSVGLYHLFILKFHGCTVAVCRFGMNFIDQIIMGVITYPL